MLNRYLALVVLCGSAGCNNPPTSAVREKVTTQGTWRVKYEPKPDPIPFNQLFALAVSVTKGTSGVAASEVTELKINATMPSHGHGMQTTPQVTRTGDGAFTVEGMQFHMAGTWEMKIDPRNADGTENVVFNLRCCGE